MYVFSYDARVSGAALMPAALRFAWSRMQFTANNNLPQKIVASFGALLFNDGTPAWHVCTIVPGEDNSSLLIEALPYVLSESDWYRFTYTFDMVHKQLTGPRVDQLTSLPGRICSIGVTARFMQDLANLGTFWDDVECMRVGMDPYSGLTGVSTWFDNIAFEKSPGVSGTVILDAPGTASPFIGNPERIYWQVSSYTPLPANSQLSDYPMSVDASLNFHSAVPQGVSDIYIKGSTFLSTKVPSVTVGAIGTFTNLGPVQMYNGDADGSDVIDTADYIIFANSYDLSFGDPLYDARADFDGDEYVSSDDYLILSENFSMEGDLFKDGR